jgi:hypothetical protein
MELDTFKTIANKCKEKDIPIGALFCFGEPLLDPTIIEKYRYAKSIGVLTEHVGWNTNVSLLTPDKWDEIINTFMNITLSFYATGDKYKELTGGEDFQRQYDLAVGFIKRRDKINPAFPIFIGCNEMPGRDFEAVKKAFFGYNVEYAVDSYLNWRDKNIIGPLNRMIKFNHWRCDGWTGALQIKWNSECTFCAYDMIGNKTDGYWETSFGNFFDLSWDEINTKFKQAWKTPSSLCTRCDMWHCGKTVESNNFKIPEVLPEWWNEWKLC